MESTGDFRKLACASHVHGLSQSVQAAIMKISQTGWLIDNGNLFLMVLEARSLRECQNDLVLVKALFWVTEYQFLAMSSPGRRCRISFIRTEIPSSGIYFHDLHIGF